LAGGDLVHGSLESALVYAVVPDVQLAPSGEVRHRVPVGRSRARRGSESGLLRHGTVTRCQHERGRQTLDVPLERAGVGLVEVVHVEHHGTVRCPEQAEVRQVRITAQLRGQRRPRLTRKVAGHHQGAAAVERERTHRHPRMPHRDELLNARRLLTEQQLDWVSPVSRHRPLSQPGAGVWVRASRPRSTRSATVR